MFPPIALIGAASHPDAADVTYYTRVAAKAPVVVFVDRAGRGRVCRFDGPLRVVSTFSIEPATNRASNRDAGYTYTALPSPDGKRALIIDPDFGRFRVAQLQPFRTLWRSGELRAQISQSIWSDDGERIVVPGVASPNASRVFRAGDGRPLGTIPIGYPFALHRNHLYGIAGPLLRPLGVMCVDLRSLKPVRLVRDRSVEDPLGVSPDGRYLVTGGRDRIGEHFQYRIWRTVDGRRTASFLGQGRSTNHPIDPLFIGEDRFALLAVRQLRRLPDGRLLRWLPAPPDGTPSGGVFVPDLKRPLAPRYLIPPPETGT